MPDIKDIDALTSLGLTVLQAKVYFALANSGKATIKILAKNTNIARQDIYRLTAELQEIGLIEKILALPNEYRAVTLKEGVALLLQRKNKENFEIRKKADELLQRQKNENIKNLSKEGKSQFILIPEKTALALKLKKEIESAKKSADVICSWKKFTQGFGLLGAELDDALKRGVTFRFIVEKPSQEQPWSNSAQIFMKKPNFKVRTLRQIPDCIIAIYDDKELLVSISSEGNVTESPAIWANNSGFITVFQEFFDSRWKKSEEQKV